MRATDDLLALVQFLGIEKHWDLILLGDGSGSQPDLPGGWACFGVERCPGSPAEPGQTVVFHEPVWGAVSAGPINLMESMAYWGFLHHFHYYGGGRERCKKTKLKTHIVTDSEWAAANMSGKGRTKYHRELVTVFAMYHDWGYQLHWHHVNRETILLQSLADRLSAQAREYLLAVEAPPEFREAFPPKQALPSS